MYRLIASNSMKRVESVLFVYLLFGISVLTGCDQKVNEPTNQKLTEYFVINENLGDQIDLAIIGSDGFGYFYKFQDENPNIPKKLSIYDGNRSIVDLVINFDEYGLPKNMLSENVTIVLGNYVENRFDAVAITKDGESQLFENVETDFSWDDYKTGLLSGEVLQRVSTLAQSSTSSNTLNWIGIGVSSITCFLGNYINCVWVAVDVGEAIGLWEVPQFIKDIRFLQSFYSGFPGCEDFLDCLDNVLGLVTYEGDDRENARLEAINKGIIMLQQTGNGNASHTGGPGVYVAGYERNAQNIDIAKLWKNGIVQNLTDGTRGAQARSVYVAGDDVYVAGYESNSQNYNHIAKLWKNGVAQNLTDGTKTAHALSVFVSGSDVYVAGDDGERAVVWKNGVAQNLNDGTNSEVANSVFVSGSDVYVAGTIWYGYERSSAVQWKNGVQQILSGGTEAHSIYVYGTDVYVVGEYTYTLMDANSAILWKNGVQQRRPLYIVYFDDENSFASAHSVFVANNNVYVAGKQINWYFRARLWKNGEEQYLVNASNFAAAYSVYVSGGDVYVAGMVGNSAVLWINGVGLGLSTGWSVAHSVFVKE